MAQNKLRLDQMLVNRGLAETRTRAQALIKAGYVLTTGHTSDKPAQQVAFDAEISVTGIDHPWVSRGGIKLAHALQEFGVDVAGSVAIDVGSSTGGFTDVLLSNGAAHVYAVDSGTDQLAQKLHNDARVTVHEQTNARTLTSAHIPQLVDIIVCDASFIGLAKVLEKPMAFAKHNAQVIALIKPQFEAGRGVVGKGGVVRNKTVHDRVCGEVRSWLESNGWCVRGLTTSPVTGPQGNIEFLIWAQKVPSSKAQCGSSSN